MVMSINEIKQVIYEADKKIRNLVMFASPSMVKSIKEALPSIEEKIVIQETEWVKDGQVVVVGRETFEKWVNHDFDCKVESEQESFINKLCVSEKVCEHDKKVVLDKISKTIEPLRHLSFDEMSDIERRILEVIK